MNEQRQSRAAIHWVVLLGLVSPVLAAATDDFAAADDSLSSSFLDEAPTLNADQMSELSGGKGTLVLDLSWEDKTVINGEVVQDDKFSLPAFDPTKAGSIDQAIQQLGLNDPTPAETDPKVLTNGLFTLIQNSKDNQDISHARVISLELHNISSLKNLPLLHSLASAQPLFVIPH
jgi:hypothetical protein